MRRAQDGGIPVGHHDVVAIGKTVRAAVFFFPRSQSSPDDRCACAFPGTKRLTSSEAFLALLQLLEQTEIPGHLRHCGSDRLSRLGGTMRERGVAVGGLVRETDRL